MKNFVKLMLPIGAFLLASAAAVTTTEVTSGTETAAIEGWRRIAINNCVSPVMCNNIPSVICKTGPYDAYGKVGLDCVQPLFHTP
jgi:hypothetical protein